MRELARLAVVCAAALAPVAATAQSDAEKGLAGPWEISNAARDKTCPITLRADAAPGGRKLEFDRSACGNDFPPLKEAGAWTLAGDDIVRIVSAKGKVLYEFTEVETGTYESLKPGQPLTFLQSAGAIRPPPRTAEQMTGDWSVVRGASAPICTLTLALTAAGSDTYGLKVQPGCDRAVNEFGPTSWQMDNGELVIKSARGPAWRFEENDGTWQRIPEGTNPIMLVRP